MTVSLTYNALDKETKTKLTYPQNFAHVMKTSKIQEIILFKVNSHPFLSQTIHCHILPLAYTFWVEEGVQARPYFHLPLYNKSPQTLPWQNLTALLEQISFVGTFEGE